MFVFTITKTIKSYRPYNVFINIKNEKENHGDSIQLKKYILVVLTKISQFVK